MGKTLLLMNIAVIAIVVGLAYTVELIGMQFGWGMICGILLFHVTHRLHYGHWFGD